MTERVLTAPLEPIASQGRSAIVDIVKGIAITLVVFGHTAQGMVHRQWWTGRSSVLFDQFVYSFHMPAFFFVAGIFLSGSLQRRGPTHFVMDKLRTILYPYLLWISISELIEPLIGRFKMSSPSFDWKDFVYGLLDGRLSWFLPVLFLCQLLALCTWKMPGWLRFSLALLASVTMSVYGPIVFHKTVWEFCFLAAGMMTGSLIFTLVKVPVWAAASSGAAIFAFQAAVVLHDGQQAQFGEAHQWLAVILGLMGTGGLLMLARVLDGTRCADLLVWLGKASLAIFLLSAFPQGAVRELLLRLAHTHELWLQLVLPSVLALAIPAIVWHRQERWRIAWLFRWPFHER